MIPASFGDSLHSYDQFLTDPFTLSRGQGMYYTVRTSRIAVVAFFVRLLLAFRTSVIDLKIGTHYP